MTTTTDTCWADPLSRAERCKLAAMLARACKRFWDEVEVMGAQWPAHQFTDREVAFAHGLTMASAEMSDLHLDVTERAAVPPEVGDRAKRAAEDDPETARIIRNVQLLSGIDDDPLGLEG